MSFENRHLMLNFPKAAGTFADVLAESPYADRLPMPQPVPHVPGARDVDTHGTTVIAVKYKDGVINVADRRATAGYTVMYDQAEKVLSLDDYTLISISGSFAKSVEVVRYLRHAFKYFERSQLQPMSMEGKLMELQRVIANNVPAALQGIGAFIPVLSLFDREANQSRIYFYDVLGGQFETAEFRRRWQRLRPHPRHVRLHPADQRPVPRDGPRDRPARVADVAGNRRRPGHRDRRLGQVPARRQVHHRRRHPRLHRRRDPCRPGAVKPTPGRKRPVPSLPG